MILPSINIPVPQQRNISIPREDVPFAYADLLEKNPLLGRIEGSLKAVHWTDLEIRTMQLLTAVASNSSLQQRLKELESNLATQ